MYSLGKNNQIKRTNVSCQFYDGMKIIINIIDLVKAIILK